MGIRPMNNRFVLELILRPSMWYSVDSAEDSEVGIDESPSGVRNWLWKQPSFWIVKHFLRWPEY